MQFAGIKVPDTTLVLVAEFVGAIPFQPRDALLIIWHLLSEGAELAPDPELLAVSAILHDLGLTDRYTAENRFEVDGANAARAFLKDRGISTQQTQIVWGPPGRSRRNLGLLPRSVPPEQCGRLQSTAKAFLHQFRIVFGHVEYEACIQTAGPGVGSTWPGCQNPKSTSV